MTPATPPNIILCTCDQLRAFEVGCYGNPVVQSPHLDRLAAEGVRFETAVTNYPVCMAARSVLLSGQYNRTCTGGVGNATYPGSANAVGMPEYPLAGRPHLKDTTLAEALKAQGYDTTAIGKWHIHSWPTDVGFDHYLIPRVHHCHTGQSFTEDGGPEFVPPGYSVDFEAERVERFLAERSHADKPFFLYYNISPPHCPVADAPVAYRTMYRPQDVPIRTNVDLDRPLDDREHWFKVYRWDFRYYMHHLPYTEHLPADYTLRHLMAEYYGMTTWMDAAFGRMLAALDAAGLAEDTIVVFTSDHGDNLGSHGLVQKGGPNEESIRVPLVVRWPKELGASRVVRDRVASLVDIAPTLLSLLDVEPPASMQGVDLAASLQDENAAPQRAWAFVETGRGAGVRAPSHMLFVPYVEGTRELDSKPSEVYDLRRDPDQMRNVAASEELADAVRQWTAQLHEWDRSTPWMSVEER